MSVSTTRRAAGAPAGRRARSGRGSLSSAPDADLAQDLVVVLAETWSPTPPSSLEQSACRDLRVRRNLVEVGDRPATHRQARQEPPPPPTRLCLEAQLLHPRLPPRQQQPGLHQV